LALQRILSNNNIRKGLSVIGIFLLNKHAVDSQMLPLESYQEPANGVEKGEPLSEPSLVTEEGGHGGNAAM
jgi:hypothetical protein